MWKVIAAIFRGDFQTLLCEQSRVKGNKMIQDISAHRAQALQLTNRTPSMTDSQYKLALGIFSLAITISMIAAIQTTMNM